jgi:hypothetical protein
VFIYKITNTENNLCYIGFDTHLEHLQHRWKTHQKDCVISNTKFYKALNNNIEKFHYEIIDRAETILDLALREIYWIDNFDSYRNGYNSTRGGDGLNQDLSKFTEGEIASLKNFYSLWMTEYNYNVKWKDKSAEEKQELTSHLHTEDIYKKKAETLKKFYEGNPSIKKDKGAKIKEWQKNNREQLSKTNRQNGLKGSEKVSKKVKIEFQNGDTKIYNSKSEFNREHGEIINVVIRKTKEGNSHRGFKGWEI